MTKFSVLVFTLLVSSSGWASHHVSCEVEAKVTEVKNLDRLDGEATFTGSPTAPLAPKNDFEQVVTIEILSVGKMQSRTCLTKGSTSTLYVQPKQQGTYTVGQTLKLDYLNQGDRLGSRVTWSVIRP